MFDNFRLALQMQPPDLLAHKYRPSKDQDFICHWAQSRELRRWIEQFLERFDRQAAAAKNDNNRRRKRNRESNHLTNTTNATSIILKGNDNNNHNHNHDGGHPYVQLDDDDDVGDCDDEADQKYSADFTIDDDSSQMRALSSCVILYGPPGVGKTSLVYAIADQLKLHVVECHASEKRDAKSLGRLKLANQKQRINRPPSTTCSPLSAFFSKAATKVPCNINNADGSANANTIGNNNKNEKEQKSSLSVSTASSLILFDDVDVLFEDDGPFWASLVRFVESSQRPVLMTATQSIDKIKELLPDSKLIHLHEPPKEQYMRFLQEVCLREGFDKRPEGGDNNFLEQKLQQHQRANSFKQLIYNFQCDIRQCLNQIHFYQGTRGPNSEADSDTIIAAFHLLDFENSPRESNHQCILNSSSSSSSSNSNSRSSSNRAERGGNRDLLKLYNSIIFADVIKSQFNLTNDRKSMVQSWIDSKPTSFRPDGYDYNNELGRDIHDATVSLSREVFKNKLLDYDRHRTSQELYQTMRANTSKAYHRMDLSIRGRVESYEPEFKTDIAPFLALIIQSEEDRRQSNTTVNARRIKRFLHYLDTREIYLDGKESLANVVSNFGLYTSKACDIFLNSEIDFVESQVFKNTGNEISHDSEATCEYYCELDDDSDIEEIPIFNSRKRLKTIEIEDDDATLIL